MTLKELEVFNNMPFLFWVKNGEGVYIFANEEIRKLADGEIIGKTDYELPWAKDADKLQEADREVLDSGKTQYIHEFVDEAVELLRSHYLDVTGVSLPVTTGSAGPGVVHLSVDADRVRRRARRQAQRQARWMRASWASRQARRHYST